jgi:hypothetical protein
LRKLRRLDLTACAVTDASGEAIGQMTSLSDLSLYDTKFGDAWRGLSP